MSYLVQDNEPNINYIWDMQIPPRMRLGPGLWCLVTVTVCALETAICLRKLMLKLFELIFLVLMPELFNSLCINDNIALNLI